MLGFFMFYKLNLMLQKVAKTFSVRLEWLLNMSIGLLLVFDPKGKRCSKTDLINIHAC